MRTAQRLEVLLIACQTETRFESPSRDLHMEHRCRRVRSRRGGGHEEAFPLAPPPLSLSSPMSKADGAAAPCVCVFMRRGTCKCRLMRHTQVDTRTRTCARAHARPCATWGPRPFFWPQQDVAKQLADRRRRCYLHQPRR